MNNLFGFMKDFGNYNERKVARFPEGSTEWLVDTAAVSDSDQPFETAVKHPAFNDGKMVIVELYPTRADAEKGHARWVKKMTAKKLPLSLEDVSSCGAAQMLDALGASRKFLNTEGF